MNQTEAFDKVKKAADWLFDRNVDLPEGVLFMLADVESFVCNWDEESPRRIDERLAKIKEIWLKFSKNQINKVKACAVCSNVVREFVPGTILCGNCDRKMEF